VVHRQVVHLPVHPHVRGAINEQLLEAALTPGLPPRAWGGRLLTRIHVITDHPALRLPMSANTYCLATRPWLLARPLRAEAETKSIGLREVLARAHEYADVEVPLPPATAGLWRVLALLTARVTGLDTAEDLEDWLERRAQVLARGQLPEDAIDSYF